MQCVHSFGQGEVGYSHYKECTFWIAALFFDKIMDNFDVYAYMEDVWAWGLKMLCLPLWSSWRSKIPHHSMHYACLHGHLAVMKYLVYMWNRLQFVKCGPFWWNSTTLDKLERTPILSLYLSPITNTTVTHLALTIMAILHCTVLVNLVTLRVQSI